MKKKATYLLAVCLSFWAGFFTLSNAQQTAVGVIWEVPANTYSAEIELGTFKNLGITHIEISYPVNEEIKSLLRDSSFSFLIRSPHKFLTISGIQQQKSALRTTITELGREYSVLGNVSGIGVVTHSQTYHPDFLPSVNSILSSAFQEIDTPFYFVQNQSWYKLSSPENPFAVYFDDSDYQRSDLKHFSDFMAESGQDEIQIIHSKWLLEATYDFPEIETALKEFTANGKWILPHPNTKETTLKANWMVLILIFLWVSLTLQIRYLPYVRSSIIRYFFAHRFFVDDILGYRERAVAGGILQMITHAIFGGLVFFMTAHVLFSDLGLEAILYHYPWLSVAGENHYSFFVFGVGLVLLTEPIALLWLHLPAKNLTHFSQTLNLYSGIFYIDYVIVTLMLTLFTAETGYLFVMGFAFAFIFIWYLSFYITAFDIAQNNRDNKSSYLLLTIVLYSLISITLLVLVIMFIDVYSVLQLAVSL